MAAGNESHVHRSIRYLMDGLALLSDDRLQWLAVPTPA